MATQEVIAVDVEQPHLPDRGGVNRGRVLIVEDDVGTRTFLSVALTRAGFEVGAMGAAQQAIEQLEQQAWHVLLVDIGLPGMSGFDLVHYARSHFPGLPTALMTADARVDVAIQALRSEVDDFLPKPISPKDLIGQVERLIQRQRYRNRLDRTPERVLAIGAHPDDVELGVGATLLRHRAAGDEVAILTLSRGAAAEPTGRARQAETAANILAANLYLRDLPPGTIPEGDPTIGLIEELIASFEPTLIYTHSIHDARQDHRHVHQATIAAAGPTIAIYGYESPSVTVEFQPQRFVAIDGFIDSKINLLDPYRSQTEGRAYLAEDLVRATARYWGGRFSSGSYGEPLEVVREREGVVAPSAAGTSSAADPREAGPTGVS